jgi:hypothetical protein
MNGLAYAFFMVSAPRLCSVAHHVCAVRKRRPLVETTRRTLTQFREAIQSNQVAFPQPAPKFACQCRPEVQWRIAELFLIHGWTCSRLAARYGVTRGRIWQFVRTWLDRATALGYLQDIPPAEPMIAVGNQVGAVVESPMPFPSQRPPVPVVANNPLPLS